MISGEKASFHDVRTLARIDLKSILEYRLAHLDLNTRVYLLNLENFCRPIKVPNFLLI